MQLGQHDFPTEVKLRLLLIVYVLHLLSDNKTIIISILFIHTNNKIIFTSHLIVKHRKLNTDFVETSLVIRQPPFVNDQCAYFPLQVKKKSQTAVQLLESLTTHPSTPVVILAAPDLNTQRCSTVHDEMSQMCATICRPHYCYKVIYKYVYTQSRAESA